jgi:hypothetical protein
VVEALTVYRSIHGDFSNLTDGTFVVPSRSDEFLDLDSSFDMFENDDASRRAAAAMASFEQRRRAATFQTDSIYAELEELDSERAEQSKTATSTARAIAGSPDDWPEHLGGMALGSIVERIRDGSLEVKHIPERKEILDELGFDWGDPKRFIDVPFEKAMCAMYAYYLVRGDMFVYEDFVMPDEDPWPQALAGFELGKTVHRIRQLQNFFEAFHPEKVSLLRMIEFAWFPSFALPIDPDAPEMSDEMQILERHGHPDYAFLGRDFPIGLMDKLKAAGAPFVDPLELDTHLWWRAYHSWDVVKDYWYEKGRRDNAYYLRATGFPQMAAEHEAKYGPGLFTHLNETLEVLQRGIENLSSDERFTLKDKVSFFLKELEDCTDITVKERKALIRDLDRYLFDLSDGLEGSQTGEPEEEAEEEEYEFEYVEVEEEVEEGEEDDEGLDGDEEWDEYYEEEFEEEDLIEESDLDDELGLV